MRLILGQEVGDARRIAVVVLLSGPSGPMEELVVLMLTRRVDLAAGFVGARTFILPMFGEAMEMNVEFLRVEQPLVRVHGLEFDAVEKRMTAGLAMLAIRFLLRLRGTV